MSQRWVGSDARPGRARPSRSGCGGRRRGRTESFGYWRVSSAPPATLAAVGGIDPDLEAALAGHGDAQVRDGLRRVHRQQDEQIPARDFVGGDGAGVAIEDGAAADRGGAPAGLDERRGWRPRVRTRRGPGARWCVAGPACRSSCRRSRPAAAISSGDGDPDRPALGAVGFPRLDALERRNTQNASASAPAATRRDADHVRATSRGSTARRARSRVAFFSSTAGLSSVT